MSITKIENPDIFRDNIRKKINTIIENEKYSVNVEKGIFNYTLKEAEQKKIVMIIENNHKFYFLSLVLFLESLFFPF